MLTYEAVRRMNERKVQRFEDILRRAGAEFSWAPDLTFQEKLHTVTAVHMAVLQSIMEFNIQATRVALDTEDCDGPLSDHDKDVLGIGA